ncbi:MAG: polyprenyl synthetase family protein [Candidatus Peribacteraceae bacterium]|nr:polyprenyl synthetase family protein [Candidatus Peribacteraceae bacterium]
MGKSASFSAFAGRTRPLIESALDRYTNEAIQGCAPGIQEAMRYSLLNPGKRIRPLLTLLAADACGGDAERALPVACAVEMVHVFSLIHDDLPAMDDDDLRRGKPTNHKVYGEGEAILAGDALLTLAFQILADDIRPPQAAARCASVLARAIGACGMQGGQWDDIRGLSDTLSVAGRKTAALIEASCHLGAITAEASPEEITALQAYGWRVGLAFQLIDDSLDEAANDCDTLKTQARLLTDEAVQNISSFGTKASVLIELAEQLTKRDR